MELSRRICLVRLWLLLLSFLLGFSAGSALNWREQEGKEVWDYVTVREDARMFWWLYYATNPCKNFSELPLVMWLQGGPGGSSTGFGNFEEIGPLDTRLKPRNTTWAIQQGTIKCNFSGVALGDSWISPVDSVLSWGPYLYSVSLLDNKGLAEVSDIAEQVLNAVNKGFYKEATQLWGKAEMIIEKNTDGVNFYNILTKSTPDTSMESSLEFFRSPLVRLCQRHVRHLQGDALSQLMNGPIKKKLKIIPDDVSWGAQSSSVFISMEEDFMKPVIDIVDTLLELGVNVTVYNGQLDLIVDTIGQESWVQKLKWPQLSRFNQLKWKALYTNPKSSETSAFVKSYENLAFYWILKAGHMVPADQGDMALKMMRLVTQQE
ncbi:retinoid-inducible serine carboxypeptidase isoform X3 [Rattus norvegicus]|uniref:retinoid-inducible serine carboxypeptidase isoform X3 n=1 Tax=Rattus norvegicus TaxID=10116 RepID=UPI0019175C69|nr:retinoid-inducible serine carboxypeptidase isoform X2 [Rattus norvegicus]